MSFPPMRKRLAEWLGARLYRRIMAALAVVMLVLSLAFLIALSQLYRGRINAEQERAALQIGRLLHAALETAMLRRDLPGLQAILNDVATDPDIRAIRILNPDLEVRFATDPAFLGEHLDAAETRSALETRQPLALPVASGGDAGVRAVEPVANREPCQQCHGPIAAQPLNGLLVIDYDGAGLDAEMRRTGLALALAGLGVMLAGLAAAALVLRRSVTLPLERLDKGTRALAGGDYDHRLPVHGSDEVARLSRHFNDMSERLQAAVARLDEAGRTLQAVIDAIPDGIRVIGPDYRILMANRAYARQVGRACSGVIGQPCHLLSYDRDAPCADTLIVCPVAEAAKGGLPLTCRQTHRDAAGAERHMEIGAARLTLSVEGVPASCVVEAIRDLDGQAQLSQEQRLNELGLLAAGLAHEIHNPLSSITLLLDATREDLAAGGTEMAARRLGTIGSELHRTLSLTNSLMLLAAPQSDDPVLIELERTIPEALAILSFQARAAGAVVDCHVAPGLRLLATEGDMRMMLTNLVLNAFHAMPAGGTVRITARREAGRVTLTVADQGTGISPADLARIFLPFWTRRADGSPGRGLGLSIVQSVIRRWGGEIAVDSRPGAGTTFTIRFPDPDAMKGRRA